MTTAALGAREKGAAKSGCSGRRCVAGDIMPATCSPAAPGGGRARHRGRPRHREKASRASKGRTATPPREDKLRAKSGHPPPREGQPRASGKASRGVEGRLACRRGGPLAACWRGARVLDGSLHAGGELVRRREGLRVGGKLAHKRERERERVRRKGLRWVPVRWFELYPEFRSNPFYISGESYAGIYIPTIADEVVKGIEKGMEPRINFKGYLIGNAATDVNYDYNSFVPFAHGMGLISNDMYEEVKAACHGTFWGSVDDLCQEQIDRVHWELKDLNKYILAPCYHHPEIQEA
ncbi:hypothetical protein PR202_gb26014 [Eleusine coracana subsp. coracana]|uniref:Carboxypeptidase n=1 Tax=Eleusine coracana subsp. coracana TaxID=191504 RepID=A0AAV5FQ40_ELECO|nr:hypothetical protein PR202_gb26014 [Eleusine coracana subsp. coracana]